MFIGGKKCGLGGGLGHYGILGSLGTVWVE